MMTWLRLLSSLRVRLMLLVLLAIIPVLLIILYDATQLRRREVAKAQADALTLSQLVGRQHEEVIEATRQTLISLAQLPEVRNGDSATCSARLIMLLQAYQGYNAFSAVWPNGDVFCTTVITTEPLSAADRTWFQRAKQSHDFSVGDYQIGRINGTPVVGFGYPVLAETGEIQAIVGASLNVEQLNQVAAEANLPPGTTLTIMDRDGTLIVRQPDSETWIGQTLPTQPLVKTILAVGEGKTELADLDGVTRLFAFTPLHSAVDTGLYLAIGIPKEVAFAEADRIWTRYLLILGLITLLALAAAWLGSDIFVLHPVNRLISATQRLRSDLSARTGLVSAGELGQLARAFDDLAAALEQRQIERIRTRQELVALNASLEARVAERTTLVQLLQDVAIAANQASTLKEALQFTLDRVCAHTGAPVGHVYELLATTGAELISTNIWHLDDPQRFAAFQQLTAITPFEPGERLPGLVLASGQPAWIIDVTHDPNFQRAEQARLSGLKAGWAFPVLVGQEVVAVLEFFAEEAVAPLESLLEVMSHIGVQLGRVVERQRAETQIRESEQRLAEAQRIAHIGSWQWDIPANNVAWSDELYRIYGLSPAQFSASYEGFLDRIHPEDRDLARQVVEKAYQNHQPFNYEHRIIRPDGAIRTLHAQGTVVVDERSQPIKMVGIGHDITERKQAEAEIRSLNAELEQRVIERTAQLEAANHELAREVEERKRAEAALEGQRAFLRQIIDINPNLIFAKDRAGRFILVNQAVAEVYGATVEEVIGKTDADFNPNPEEVEHFRRDDLAVLDSLQEKFIPEEVTTDATGRVRWLQTVKRPLLAENGQVVQLLGVATDITERKQIEAELREQSEIIETVNRVGQMLAAELDMQKLVQAITDAATELSGAQFGAFFYNVVDSQGESYTLYTISGAPREAFEQFPLPRNTELFGPTFRGEGIVRIDDVKKDPRYGQNPPHHGMPAGHLPVTSYLAVPVISRSGETMGGLFFGHPEAGVFTERIERLIAGLVSQAAVAIDNAHLYQQAQQLNATLEQRVAERTAELQASEQIFRELVQSLPIAVYVCDADGLIESYNRRAVELWGRQPRIGDSADRFCGSYKIYTRTGAYLPHVDCPMAQVLHIGVALSNAEIVVERPDGSRRIVIANAMPRRDERGNITGAINCLIDITDLKQTEEALRQSRAMFQSLFESAPDAIILTNDQGQIVQLNRQTEELFGYDRVELLHKPIETLLPTRFQTRHLKHRVGYYADPHSRQMGFGLDLYGQRRDGVEVPVDITLSPLRIEDDILTISIIRDITANKRMEAELTTIQRQLLESSETERLRIAQELHDGPIQELYGISFRLGELEQALPDETSQGQLVAAAAMTQQVTQNLRMLCMELRPPTLAAFGLEKAIRSHVAYFQAAHPELEITLELAADGQRLPERLRLALFRIHQEALNNIVRHAQACQIWVRLRLNEGQVVLEIQDDGRGFEVPQRWVHLTREGHLGLAGMRERIQAINGQLEIISAPGKGTLIQAAVPYLNQPVPTA